VEGYVESCAMGLLAGRFAAADRLGTEIAPPPPTTALGALLAHVTGGHLDSESTKNLFQPMNVNFGLFPDVPQPAGVKRKLKGLDRKKAMTARAKADLVTWLG
jgi:methylenetetrahydrofolate--tRNA-(uracil-5-)-methyltransferase